MTATLLFSILLLIATVLLLILLALYRIPVTIETVAGCTQECVRATATLDWGIVGVRVRATDGVRVLEVLLAGHQVMTRDLAERAAAPLEGGEEARELRPPLPVREYISAAVDLWPHIQTVIVAFIRSLTLETLRGDITLGLENPADTGVIYGYCTAVRYALWPAEAVDFVMTPVFDREVFEGTFSLRMQVCHPLLIIIPSAKALLQKPVRKRLWQASGRGRPDA